MDRSYRILRPARCSVSILLRLQIRFEYGLQHDHGRRLYHSVGDRRPPRGRGCVSSRPTGSFQRTLCRLQAHNKNRNPPFVKASRLFALRTSWRQVYAVSRRRSQCRLVTTSDLQPDFAADNKKLFPENPEPGLFNNRFRSWLASRSRSNLMKWTPLPSSGKLAVLQREALLFCKKEVCHDDYPHRSRYRKIRLSASRS